MTEEMCHKLMDATPDAVMIADRQGVICYWNDAAVRIFGFSHDEAIGSSLDLIIPEPLRKRHWEGYRRVMECGVTSYGDRLLSVPGITRQGDRISLEFSVALLKDGKGGIIWCGAILRDVTSRWEREREIERRLSECESKQNPQ
ncbi:MAG: PAS domain S-box protein [Desulfuromonadia bacterium]